MPCRLYRLCKQIVLVKVNTIYAFLKLDAILELLLAIHIRVLTKPQYIPQWLVIFKQKTYMTPSSSSRERLVCTSVTMIINASSSLFCNYSPDTLFMWSLNKTFDMQIPSIARSKQSKLLIHSFCRSCPRDHELF